MWQGAFIENIIIIGHRQSFCHVKYGSIPFRLRLHLRLHLRPYPCPRELFSSGLLVRPQSMKQRYDASRSASERTIPDITSQPHQDQDAMRNLCSDNR